MRDYCFGFALNCRFDVQGQHRVAIREHWVKFYELNTVRRGPPYPTWSTLLLHYSPLSACLWTLARSHLIEGACHIYLNLQHAPEEQEEQRWSSDTVKEGENSLTYSHKQYQHE
ncbi:hypothetical protein DPMN_105915 [Dreissena polymorpha]|uniref:Uncharacterized protein n=1 Tax=Dreissena polymorpha TaxID=45954 RepID=A0A9D4K419_DREPO|nr:hypothetical protein DPMN_105915 [Dreissena polymorpha]